MGAVGAGAAALGLGSVLAAGRLQMAESIGLQLINTYTNMGTTFVSNMASMQKTVMEAMSGVGSALSNGASAVLEAIFSSNQQLGNAFRRAGGGH